MITKNKSKLKRISSRFVWATIIIIIFFITFFGYQYINKPNSNEWKTYNNSKYNFSFKYPSHFTIKTKTTPDFHLFLYDKSDEVLRAHVYKETTPFSEEFKLFSADIGGKKFNVNLYPPGLPGDFAYKIPLLYYNTYQNGLKYSFEFQDQIIISSIQKEILSTLTVY